MSFGSTVWPHMQLAYIVLSKVNSRKEMMPSVQLFGLIRSSDRATTVQQPLEPREGESRQMTILMILFQVSSWCLWAITFNFHYKLQDTVCKTRLFPNVHSYKQNPDPVCFGPIVQATTA